MDRRRFLLTPMTGALGASLGAGAQPGRMPLIGVLSPWGPSLPPRGQREPFERGPRELGWTVGSTTAIEQRFPRGRLEPKQLELLKRAIPTLTRVGVLASRVMGEPAIEEISAAARTLGLRLQILEVSRPDEIPSIFRAIAEAGCQIPRPHDPAGAARAGGSGDRIG